MESLTTEKVGTMNTGMNLTQKHHTSMDEYVIRNKSCCTYVISNVSHWSVIHLRPRWAEASPHRGDFMGSLMV